MAAVVQARTGSTRLPGKALAEIGGMPAIELLLRRLEGARQLDEVAVATSSLPADDELARVAAQAGARVVRGPLDDVLERYRMAMVEMPCDAVVRITGDCPLIDPAVVDHVVGRWRSGDEDYIANVLDPRTAPWGQDVEVVSAHALASAAVEAADPFEREHVTVYVRQRPERWAAAAVPEGPSYEHVRLDVDEPEHLEEVRRIVAEAGPWASLPDLLRAAGATAHGSAHD